MKWKLMVGPLHMSKRRQKVDGSLLGKDRVIFLKITKKKIEYEEESDSVNFGNRKQSQVAIGPWKA